MEKSDHPSAAEIHHSIERLSEDIEWFRVRLQEAYAKKAILEQALEPDEQDKPAGDDELPH